MKKLFLETLLLTAIVAFPATAMARVSVRVGIALPPAIAFSGPPRVIVMPDANNVYVDPDLDADLFFWNGFWWRLWDGHWYRSPYYDRGWAYYRHVPRFYLHVDPDWRRYYRGREWHGHPWNYRWIPHRELQRNWRSWEHDRHWERHGAWGVKGYHGRH